VGTEVDRWISLLDQLDELWPGARLAVYSRLEEFGQTLHEDTSRERIWKVLLEKSRHHGNFHDAAWALPSEEIALVESLAAQFQPHDLVTLERWLFDEWLPIFGTVRRTDTAASDRERDAAINRVRNASGNEAVIRLARSAKFSGLVGRSAARSFDANTLEALLAESFRDEKLNDFTAHLSAEAAALHPEWRTRLLQSAGNQKWDPHRIALELSLWPDTRQTWDLAASFGGETRDAYWRSKPLLVLNAELDDRLAAIENYIRVGRATQLLSVLWDESLSLPVPILLEVLDSALATVASQKNIDWGSLSYWVSELFKALAEREDIDETKVAQREYQWLPLLKVQERSLVLDRVLARDPGFFVQVLVDVYRASEGPTKLDEKPTRDEEARASVGHQLLSGWSVFPGGSETNEINQNELERWVEVARSLAKEKDRLGVCDREIGRLFAHAPIDPIDQTWPHVAVRTTVEKILSDDLERGLSIERFNMRGVVHKGLYEGGSQERATAQRYTAWAANSSKWPRTQRLLTRLSEEWEQHAGREDVSAEHSRMRDH
jgi:hypothetical protein